jgi:hypothetical protein
MRRIIGQCNIADFKDLDALAIQVDTSGKNAFMLPRELTKKEKNALRVAGWFMQCGVSTRVLQKIKEVLIWDEYDNITGKHNTLFEYKLLDPKDYETARIIMDMKPKEKIVGGKQK